MRIIQRAIRGLSRSDTITIVPLYDLHVGAAACNEKRLTSIVERIRKDPHCYWIGGGDFCEFINLKDRRFDPETLADWLSVKALSDVALAQRDRVLDILKPIAGQCLALLAGNHEESIRLHFERDIYSEIVTAIKQAGKFKPDDVLGLGLYGWLLLTVSRMTGKEKTGGGKIFRLNLHHGFSNGRLAGSKALNMQRWLWTHDCDIAFQGHSHNVEVQVERVESVTNGGQLVMQNRYGAFCGAFLETCQENGRGTYAEAKGYLPQGQARVEARLRLSYLPEDEIEVVTI